MDDIRIGDPPENDSPVTHHTVERTDDYKGKRKRKDQGLFRPARHLARDIGPRAPGSSGERSAARFVKKELESLGLEPESQAFRTPKTTAVSETLVHGVIIAGYLFFPWNSHLSYVLVCLGLFLFLLEEYGRSPFSWMQVHRSSENVVSVLQPLRESERTVVLLAHLDSPRSAFFYRPGLVKAFRVVFMADFLSQAILFMITTVLYGGHLLSMESSQLLLLWRVGLILLLPPILAFLCLLQKAAAGKATPGGNDNASGAAVLLQVAKRFSRRHPHNTELWLVFTGASDAGARGARRLLRMNRGKLKDANFIVLDKVGRGYPVCFRKEGRLIPFRANRRLYQMAQRVSSVHVHFSIDFKRNSLFLGEGYHLISRGKRAMTVSSREKSSYTRYWRWPKDDHDNIDPRTLRLAADFVQALVDNIDRGGLKRK